MSITSNHDKNPGIASPIHTPLDGKSPIQLPPEGQMLIRAIEAGGYEAWVVGGAVRDHLLGLPVHDFDIGTSAPPDELAGLCPAGTRIVPTGIAHGTQTVLMPGSSIPFEVTVFRREGPYGDHRHPDWVRFGVSLEEDCLRRDFTINAIAWHPERGFRDPCGGLTDLRTRHICCVGEARQRFTEDALRIIRALRFALQLGFEIEAQTAAAMRMLAPLLRQIAVERVTAELMKILSCDSFPPQVFMAFPEISTQLFPGLADQAMLLAGIQRASCIPPLAAPRLVALGLPDLDAYCRRMRFSNDFRRHCLRLSELARADFFAGKAALRRLLLNAPVEDLKLAMLLQQVCSANRPALNTDHASNVRHLNTPSSSELSEMLSPEYRRIAEHCATLLKQGIPHVQDLCIRGEDLLALGLQGPDIGRCLKALHSAVLDGNLRNQRADLLAAAQAFAVQQD